MIGQLDQIKGFNFVEPLPNVHQFSNKSLFLTCTDSIINDLKKIVESKQLDNVAFEIKTKLFDRMMKTFLLNDIAISALIDHRIQVLEILRCSQVTDEGLQIISLKCPQITSISLKECTGCSWRGVVYITRNCKRLISLTLSKLILDINQITEILSYTPNLKSLTLRQCRGVNDDFVTIFATLCPKFNIS